MKVTFFFNHTQEGEGCEIIYFAAVSLSQKNENGENQYFTDASMFIQSLDTTDSVLRVLKILNFIKGESLLTTAIIDNNWDSVKAMVENEMISFKRSFTEKYTDKIHVDILLEILPKWHDYLLTVDKIDVEFELYLNPKL